MGSATPERYASLLLVILGVVVMYASTVNARRIDAQATNVTTRISAFLSLTLKGEPNVVCTNLAVGGVKCNRGIKAGGYSDSHRNILSQNTEGAYALGFDEKKAGCGEFYLSIYPWYPSNSTAGPHIWRAKGLSSSTVDETGTLHIYSRGSLELKTSLGKQIWTTGTDKAGATYMEFNLDTGNLMLFNKQNVIVWQSRDN